MFYYPSLLNNTDFIFHPKHLFRYSLKCVLTLLLFLIYYMSLLLLYLIIYLILQAYYLFFIFSSRASSSGALLTRICDWLWPSVHGSLMVFPHLDPL